MLFEKEVFRLETFNGGVQSVIIEKNGAEDGAFSIQILRERAFKSGGGSHGPFLLFAFSSLYNISSRRHASL
jgi:hypothetical protein